MLKIKVCGMCDPVNIAEVAACNPDLMGFIFYERSPRYAGKLDSAVVKGIDKTIVTTGVFVDESAQEILSIAKQYGLQAVQLHGSESAEICSTLKQAGLVVVKAIQIPEHFDFNTLKRFQNSIDYLLFDTQTPTYGGSGLMFNWDLLKNYDLDTKFFLSGGISPESIDLIAAIDHPLLEGIDINSRFETGKGMKDTQKVAAFINRLKLQL